jgi:hypothetical protein
MSNEKPGTPRTNARIMHHAQAAGLAELAGFYNDLLDHARQIEVELADCRAMVGTLNDRLKAQRAEEVPMVYYSVRDENGEWQHRRCSVAEAGQLLTERSPVNGV